MLFYNLQSMTRINSAIPPKYLTDEHLLAEHREIKRLPYNLQQAIKSGNIKKVPNKFTLGKGHVLFFVNKQRFLLSRYWEILGEASNRGFNVINYYTNWFGIDNEYWQDYKPTKEEEQLLIERISERIMNSPKKVWHYYGKPITKEEAIKLLNK